MLLAALAAISVPAEVASAAGPTMAPDTVTSVTDPGVTLALPAEGRVNGYQFTARVLGAATGTAMPSPDGTKAAPGQRLWVFGLSWSADRIFDDNGGTHAVAQVTATLVYNGARLTVPLAQPATPNDDLTTPVGSGDEYFIASLPTKTPDVVLELANGGFAQDFSLTHMARTGPQPAALYRNPNGWQTIQPLSLSKSLPTPYPASEGVPAIPAATMTVNLDSATLTYFAPDGPSDTPADPGKAWLIPDFEDPVPNFSSAFENLNYTTHAAASGLTLTLPDGTVITAKGFPGGGPDYPAYSGNDNNDVFVDRYAFLVPAGITTATITVALPPEVAYPDYGFTAPSQTYNLPPVVFPVTLPSAQPSSPAAGASDHPAAIRATTAATATNATQGRSGGSGFPWWVIAVIVLAAAGTAGGVAVSRRRRHTDTPAEPSSPTGTAGATEQPPSPPPAAPAPFVVYPADPGETTTATAPAGTATIAPPAHTNGQSPPETIAPTAPPLAATPEETAGRVDLFDLVGSDPLDGFTPPAAPTMSDRTLYIFDNMAFREWAEPPDRNPVVDIVYYLATHPNRPVSTETLRTITGSEAADPLRNTLRSNVSRARKALGDGYLPEAVAGAYVLDGVDCDLTVIEDLAARATTAERAGETDEAVWLYGQAVALIAGPPFESERPYTWVDQEDLRTHAERVAARTAHSLARLALSADQPQLALWAARQGMRADAVDQTLAAAAITAAKRSHRPGALRAEWTSITRRLAAHGVEVAPDLADLYRRLVQEADD